MKSNIHTWKEDMNSLIERFDFCGSDDIWELEKMLEKAKKIRAERIKEIASKL